MTHVDYAVVPYRAIDAGAYAALLGDCPAATPFHALDWMRIYELFSGQACQFLVSAREGERLLAAMPVTVFQKYGVRAVFSSGFGLHGGPIARPGSDPEVLTGLLQRFASDFHGPRTVLSSVLDVPGLGAPLRDCGFKVAYASTHVMALPDSYERLCDRARYDASYGTRRTAKAGIRLSRSTDTGDFERWGQLCSANYVAHGRRPYPSALYRAVATRIRETDTLRFYVAKLGRRVVGGSVHVFALRQAYYWMSATDPEFRSCGINDVVLQRALQDAIDEGCASFDFGPSPAGAEGLARFKEKWGGVRTDYRQYSWSSVLGRIGANLVRYGRVSWR